MRGTQAECPEGRSRYPLSVSDRIASKSDSTAVTWPLGQFDLHVHTRGEIKFHQRVDRLRGRLNDVQQTLVGAHLELLARLLVDVRRTVDGELLNARRKRNRTANESTRPASGVSNVPSCLIKHTMIKSLETNPDVLRFHVPTDAKEPTSCCQPEKQEAAPV